MTARSEVGGALALAIGVAAGLFGLASATGAVETPCAEGRFLVQNFPGTPAIVVTGSLVSIEGLCPATPGRVQRGRRGVRISVEWPSCQGLTGAAALKATILPPDCTAIEGIFKSKVKICLDGRCNVQRLRQPLAGRRAP